MYMNPYYRHIQDLKREFVRLTTKQDIEAIKQMLQRKAMRGNIKAAELVMKIFEWQKELDDSADKKHELEVIMGSPTDGLMKRIRPGQIALSKPEIEEKKAQ
jgi:hypothetical protein